MHGVGEAAIRSTGEAPRSREVSWMPESVVFQGIFPIGEADPDALPARELGPCVGYYTQVLGFTLVSREEDRAILRRDAVYLGLTRSTKDPAETSCYVAVNDVDALWRELTDRGIEPTAPHVDEYWGKRYRIFFAKDPQGITFCFGQPVP